MQITIQITDDYVKPEGELTSEQYVAFVLNMAAQSYAKQYSVTGVDAGIAAARDAYNAAVPKPDPAPE